MRSHSTLITLIFLFSWSAFAEITMDYSGRLIDTSTGLPITSGSVSLLIQIKDPYDPSCILYQNFFSPSLDSDGNFQIAVSGVATVGNGSFGVSLSNIMEINNPSTVKCHSSNGTELSDFSPIIPDLGVRQLQVSIWNTAQSPAAWEQIDEQRLQPSHAALNSVMLSGATLGVGPRDIVQLDVSAKIPSALLPTLSISDIQGTMGVASGGTGVDSSSAGAGQLLIGNGSGFTLGTLTAGSNVSISNSAGAITISSSNGGGTVQNIMTGSGLTGGPISTVGTLSLANVVTAGTVGSTTSIPRIGFDSHGRIIEANSIALVVDAQVITGTLSTARGGTGVDSSSAGAGQLLIGNGSGFTLGTLTAGSNVSISNSAGAITISSSNGGGTVQSVVVGAGLEGGTISSNGTISLGTTGISAGIYGSVAHVSQLSIDAFGRLVSVGSLQIAIDANQVGTGILPSSRGGTGLAVNTFDANKLYGVNGVGSGTEFKEIVAGPGISISHQAGSISIATQGVGTVTEVSAGAGLTGGPISTVGTLSLSNIITAGTVGNATSIPRIGFDSHGRVIEANSIALSVDALAITGTLSTARGGTGLNGSAASQGALLIGNGSGFALGTLAYSNGIVVTNGLGLISLATNAQSLNVNNAIVTRDGSGNFSSNSGTFNSINLNNAGAVVTLTNPVGANYQMILPASIGLSGQVLSTDGANNLLWVEPSLRGFISNVGSLGINSTVHVSVIGANPSSSNGDLVLVPKGSGALVAQVPDGATANGNKRGSYATDFQRFRNNPGRVASGDHSVLLGGQSNTASGASSIVGSGSGNTASGASSMVGSGMSNVASGITSIVGAGISNVAMGAYSSVLGGGDNIAEGDYSFTGGLGNIANSYGQTVLGTYGSISTATGNSWVSSDPIFSVGNGVDAGTRSDALVVTKNGNMRVSGNVASGGQIVNKTRVITSGGSLIDWNQGNMIMTDFNCSTNISFANLRDGGTYTLIANQAGTNQCNFSNSSSGDDANAGLVYRFKPANGTRTLGSYTIYTLMRVGGIVFVSWASGF